MSKAIEHLRNSAHCHQIDYDGVMVGVSRQAIEESVADYDALAAQLADLKRDADLYAKSMMARVTAAEARLAEAERDAALGRIALRFVDRAGDYCEQDPAERICDEFYAAMGAEVERMVGQRPADSASGEQP